MLGCALTCTHILVTDLSRQGEEHAGDHVTAISPPTQEHLLNMVWRPQVKPRMLQHTRREYLETLLPLRF